MDTKIEGSIQRLGLEAGQEVVDPYSSTYKICNAFL